MHPFETLAVLDQGLGIHWFGQSSFALKDATGLILLTTHPTEGRFPFFEGLVKLANKLRLKAAVPAHYACFLARNYDPHVRVRFFLADDPTAD